MAHVLLIEPDTLLADIMRQYLLGMDYSVSHSTNAQKALQHAEKHQPDAIVLELAIPDQNGAAFLQEFRSYTDWLHVPVVIYSHIPAEDTGLSHSEWKQHGVHSYLYKPTSGLQKLGRTLQTVILA